jgi:hypothetical protein
MLVLIGTYVNIDDPDVRAKFITPDSTAADIAANGATPFGEDILPQIYSSTIITGPWSSAPDRLGRL